MALCENCEFYNKDYAELRKNFDDCIIVGEDKREKDFCVMYEDFIPFEITYENKKCPHYMRRSYDESRSDR